jgi:hypothetical protein
MNRNNPFKSVSNVNSNYFTPIISTSHIVNLPKRQINKVNFPDTIILKEILKETPFPTCKSFKEGIDIGIIIPDTLKSNGFDVPDLLERKRKLESEIELIRYGFPFRRNKAQVFNRESNNISFQISNEVKNDKTPRKFNTLPYKDKAIPKDTPLKEILQVSILNN